MGVQWTSAVLIGASGPALVGALRDNTGDYQASFLVLTMLVLAGMMAILASGQTQSRSGGGS